MTDFTDQAENRGWTNKIKSHQYSCTYMNFGAQIVWIDALFIGVYKNLLRRVKKDEMKTLNRMNK